MSILKNLEHIRDSKTEIFSHWNATKIIYSFSPLFFLYVWKFWSLEFRYNSGVNNRLMSFVCLCVCQSDQTSHKTVHYCYYYYYYSNLKFDKFFFRLKRIRRNLTNGEKTKLLIIGNNFGPCLTLKNFKRNKKKKRK